MLMFSLNTFCFGIVCTCFGSVHGTWGSWTNWGECTKSCGGGEKVRRRLCTGDFCKEELEKDNAKETHACNFQSCLCPDDWGPWDPWKECRPDCRQTRVRSCKTSTTPGCLSICNGTSDDARHCYGQPGCNNNVCRGADVAWGRWAPWNACVLKPENAAVKTCGSGGYRERRRYCNVRVSNTACSRDCPAGSATQQGDCYVCCSDLSVKGTAVWSDWGSWTRCSAVCNAYGQRSRYRTCKVHGKTPSCTDPVCLGDTAEAENCITECCVYTKEEWEIWSGWGSCSRTCGLGRKFMNRHCFKPPLNPPAPCDSCGIDTKNTSCAPDMCQGPAACNSKFWGEWTQWTQCLTTCGGEKVSIRTCYPLGCDCPGSGIRKELCPGAVRVEWSEWTEFGKCTAGCDAEGRMSKTRTCNTLLCTCTGPSDATVSCKGPACGDNGQATYGPDQNDLIPLATQNTTADLKTGSEARTRIVLGSVIAGVIVALLAAVLIAMMCYKKRARSPMSLAAKRSGQDPQQEVNIVLRPAEDTGVGPGGVIPLAPQSYLSSSPSSTGYSEESSAYSEGSSAYSVESSADPRKY